MDKKVLERLIIVEDNLRDINWDLKQRAGYTYIPPMVLAKLQKGIDILDSFIDYLIAEIEREEKNHDNP